MKWRMALTRPGRVLQVLVKHFIIVGLPKVKAKLNRALRKIYAEWESKGNFRLFKDGMYSV